MQFLRSSLSRLALSTLVLGATVAIAPEAVDARQPCGSFTLNWGGTVRPGDILECAVEWNSGPRRSDRYYLDIKKSKIVDNFQTFELSFPGNFDGEINIDDEEDIHVKVNGREVELIMEETQWDPVYEPVGTTQMTQEETSDPVEGIVVTPNTSAVGELIIDEDGNLVFLEEPIQRELIFPVTPVDDTDLEVVEEEDEDALRSRSLIITLAEPLEPESEVEIILDDVTNPSSGGIYLVTAFARSQFAPLPTKLGSWFIDVDF